MTFNVVNNVSDMVCHTVRKLNIPRLCSNSAWWWLTAAETCCLLFNYTVKSVKLTTFIRWPPTDVDHTSVEPAKSYIVRIYDHLRNFSIFIQGEA